MTNSIIFKVFYVVVFFNLTSFYFPVATYTPISLKLQGGLFIFSCLSILFVCRMEVLRRLANWRIVVLSGLLIFFPLVSLLYTPYTSVRDIVLVVLYFLLVCSIVVVVQVKGWRPFWRVLEFALITNIVALIISYFFPNIFLNAFSGGTHLYILGQGRAPGLFVNGNQSAKVVILLVISWLAIPHGVRRNVRYVLVFASAFIAIAFTGSRSSLLVYAVVVSMAMAQVLFQSRGVRANTFKIYFIVMPMVLPILIGALLLVMKLLAPLLVDEYARGDSLGSRLEVFASGPVAIYENLIEAAQGRFNVSAHYAQKAMESPLMGHGIRSMFVERYTSGLELISHNTFITIMYEYGVLYAIVFIVWLLSLLFMPYRKTAERIFAQPLSFYFVSAVFLFFMTIGTGHELRPVWIICGALAGLMLQDPSFNVGPNRDIRRSRGNVRPVGRYR